METFLHDNETRDSFFIFHFDNGRVSIADKPEITGAELLSMAMDETPVRQYVRAKLYHRLFSHVAGEHLQDAQGFLGMDMHDVSPASSDIPYFCFQKESGERSILLPDIDFLTLHDRYDESEFTDTLLYEEKLVKATFVGSTTGSVHTRQSLQGLTNPRLCAAVHFRNDPDVDFHLPNIVQCDSPETETLIRNLGFGGGDFITWQEQFRYRFLISMDGNGATCSRVVIALKSNSVLLKYASAKRLFYFSSLIPWVHYLPVNHHDHVHEYIALEKKSPGYFKYVATAGAEFYRRFLSFESIVEYTANLLRMYFSCLHDGPEKSHHKPVAADREHPPAASDGSLEVLILAHLSNLGDVWIRQDEWPESSAHYLEGFLLQLKPPYAFDDIRYRAVYHDGALSDWHRGGEFCGTRGKAQALRGICIDLADTLKCRYSGSYSVRHSGGEVVVPAALGALCTAPEGTYLYSFSLAIVACADWDETMP